MPTTGRITKYDVSPFASTSTHASFGRNGDFNVTVEATRRIAIEADIISGSGNKTHVIWQQNLAYNNLQIYLQNFTEQVFSPIYMMLGCPRS